MKLAVGGLLIAIVVTLVALSWWRSAPSGANAVEPTSSSAAPAPSTPLEPSAPSAAVAADDSALAAREEAAAPEQSSSASATLLRVTVLSKDTNTPVAGVQLVIFDATPGARNRTQWLDGPHGKLGESPRTGTDGRVDFAVEPGMALRLACEDERYDYVSQDIEPLVAAEVRDLTLRLATEDDTVFCVRVVDDDDGGAALANARVKLGRQSSRRVTGGGSGPRDDGLPARRELEKDALVVHADGRFEIPYKSWLSGPAFAFADGYSLAVFSIEPGHETPEHALELRLSRTATVDAVVRDGRGFVEGAKVDLTTDAHRLEQGNTVYNGLLDGDHHWSATTDIDGRARIADVSPHLPLTVVVRARGAKPRQEAESLTLAPAEHRALEFVLDSGAVVSGRLQDGEGKPIAKWGVWRSPGADFEALWLRSYDTPSARAVTDDEGRFRFDDVPLGTWSIGPAPGSPEFAGLAQSVEVRTRGEQLEVMLRVDRGLFLRGTVVDPSGAPVPQCWVSAFLPSGAAYEDVFADPQGRFQLGPLPAGEWSVHADLHRGRNARSDEARVPAGTADLVLKLRTGGSVQGQIVDGRTRAATPCELLFTNLAEEHGMATRNSNDGTFELESLLPGSYVVSARTTDGRHARRRVDVRAGEAVTGVELVLDPGAKLLLRDAGRGRGCSYKVFAGGDCVASSHIDPHGSETCVVPAGALEVRWKNYATKFEETQAITLAVGEQGELTWKGEP